MASLVTSLGEANLSLGVRNKVTGLKWRKSDLGTQEGVMGGQKMPHLATAPLLEEEFCILDGTAPGQEIQETSVQASFPGCTGHFKALWVTK